MYRDFGDKDRFNIRFRPEDLTLYDLQPFAASEDVPSFHFNLPPLKRRPGFLGDSLPSDERAGEITHGDGLGGGSASEVITRRYNEQITEINNLHGPLQRKLAAYLRHQFPTHTVHCESTKVVNNTRIDIVRIAETGAQIFYEVKTYPNVCIRSVWLSVS